VYLQRLAVDRRRVRVPVIDERVDRSSSMPHLCRGGPVQAHAHHHDDDGRNQSPGRDPLALRNAVTARPMATAPATVQSSPTMNRYQKRPNATTHDQRDS
jgi:hypothetical protein